MSEGLSSIRIDWRYHHFTFFWC